jgi:hypothetical protein
MENKFRVLRDVYNKVSNDVEEGICLLEDRNSEYVLALSEGDVWEMDEDGEWNSEDGNDDRDGMGDDWWCSIDSVREYIEFID